MTWMNRALKISRRSTHRRHRMAAVLVKGGALISAAANLQEWGKHAERRCLRPHIDARGCTLYVVRSNGRISKPCADCWEVIINSGVSTVVFINKDQNIEVVRVNEQNGY